MAVNDGVTMEKVKPRSTNCFRPRYGSEPDRSSDSAIHQPAATTASGRLLDLQLTNAPFLTGDPSEMTFEEPFDAVVGRMVLMFSRNPADTLSKIAAHVRAGGIIAFQEVDFSGCRSLP